ncbi:MAG: ATP-binding protein [Proteobacteria bacterium]|nr:MAG: ATP-binding protein [Pseudomonadota bacterium]
MPKIDKKVMRLDDFTLPANAVAQLRNAVLERVATVILNVPSGSSRANAAEALAHSVGRSLVTVDLDQVVSRYVGETEKNLDRLFATAAASDAVLFFDEADALFGKRSDVRDSHDRYATLEVGYLLQKIEAHGGIVVLASSGRQPIDPAFLRRLRQVVELAWPSKGS